MDKTNRRLKTTGAASSPDRSIELNEVTAFRSCLTCVHRKPYPAAIRNGQPVFSRFICGLAADSLKEVVRPEEQCGFWKEAAIKVD